MNNVIWISWERHRRSEQLVNFLGIESYFYDSDLPRVIKHPVFILKTLFVLFFQRPRVLLIQNPSIILAFMVSLIKKLKIMNFYLIVDSHNGGILPENYAFLLHWVFRFVQQEADITIVTNDNLAKIVRNNGGNPLVLPDKIPEPIEVNDLDLPGDFKYLFVCTFSSDEPIGEVITAASSLDYGDKLYITGNYNKAEANLLKGLNNSIVLTGFLKDSDYWGYLKNVDCVIDLTLREDCLVCGAYEAVAVGTPLILSDTETLRKTFRGGAIFTQNVAVQIDSALKAVKKDKEKLNRDIINFKHEFNREWQINGDQLKLIIENASENAR